MKRVRDKIMTRETVLHEPSFSISIKAKSESVPQRTRSRWIVGLFLASTSGLLLMIFGLGLSGLVAFGLVDDPRTKGEITFMLVVSLPLLFLAAHCLDKIREIETLMKIEYCKRLGNYEHDSHKK